MGLLAKLFALFFLLCFGLNSIALELKARVTREEFAEFYGILIIEDDFKELNLNEIFSYDFDPISGKLNRDELFSVRSPYFKPLKSPKKEKKPLTPETENFQQVHEFSLAKKTPERTFKDKLIEANNLIKSGQSTDLSELEVEAQTSAVNLSNIAKLYIKKGNILKALDLLKQARELAPEDYKILYTYAITLYKNKQLTLAEIYLLETSKLKPDFMFAHYNLGNLYYKKKSYKKALDSFKKAMELSPNKPDIYFNIAITLEQLGYNEIAERFYRKCLDLNPADDGAYKAIKRLNNGL